MKINQNLIADLARGRTPIGAELARRHLLDFTQYTFPGYRANWHHTAICEAVEGLIYGDTTRLMVFTPPRHGKLCAHSTYVDCPDGPKTHGELIPGDLVWRPNGKTARVLAVSEEQDADVEVEFVDGSVVLCHENHEWVVWDRAYQAYRTLEAKQFLKIKPGNAKKPRSRYLLPASPVIEGRFRELLMDPYVLGVWLGDGSSGKPCITHDKKDQAMIDEMESRSYLHTYRNVHKTTGCISTGFSGKMWQELKTLALVQNKHIPEDYQLAPVAQRLELLAGLIDTDGYVGKDGRVVITTVMPRLRDDIARLARSFGFRVEIQEVQPTTSSSGIVGKKVVYRVAFSPHIAIPTVLPRKKVDGKCAQRRIGIRCARRVPPQKGRCIQVDAEDGLYLVGKEHHVTHNSEIVSRRLPAWYLGQFPDAEVMLASYSAELSNRMSGNVQSIMDSREYRSVFPHVRLPQGVGDPQRKIDKQRKRRTDDFFEIVGHRGNLRSAGVGGSYTGMGFNLGIIDDPVKDAEEAMSQVIRDKVWDWYTTTFYTRQTGFGGPSGGKAKILLTMTRWHDDDLAGRLLKLAKDEPDADQWKILELPAIYDGTPKEFEKRTEIGEALWEDSQYDREFMHKTKKNLPDFYWQSMYMQRPKVAGGNYFKRQLFGRYRRDGRVVHHYDNHWNLDNCRVWAAVDPASSEKSKSDFTAIAVVAEAPNGACILLDMVRERHAPTSIGQMMMGVVAKWKPSHFIFEADGNQTAVVSLARLEEGMPPIREVKHGNRSKLVRATRAIAMHESGEIMVPESGSWLEPFFDEIEAFTGIDDKHDDMVDALAYAVMPFARGNSTVDWAEQERGQTKPYQSTPLAPKSHAGGRKLWGRSR